MNRIVLIGNGFDLAHGLKTQYKDFIDWYWKDRIENFTEQDRINNRSTDDLCTIKPYYSSYNLQSIYSYYKNVAIEKFYEKFSNDEYIEIIYTPFFKNIHNCIKTKGWVDIENEYYKLLIEYTIKNPNEKKLQDLNKQLHCLQEKLIEYLKEVDSQETDLIDQVYKEIYAPINIKDIAVNSKDSFCENLEKYIKINEQEINKCEFTELANIKSFNYNNIVDIYTYQKKAERILNDKDSAINLHKKILKLEDIPFFTLPDNIMLLSFNYTGTAEMYNMSDVCSLNYIHGKLDNPDGVIFGYGDELDEKNYKELKEHSNNECLRNVKSIKYLESDSYRKVLDFIESEPFQVYIMGHSCGNSDRTLLNTLFEHENCISIKPYYYQKDDGTDNYTELIQNISRNFTDMKLMRDRVVNKTYCKLLPQNK